MPHWSGLIVHGKFLADLLPKVQPLPRGAVHVSLILRLDATPVQSFCELNVKTEGVPLGDVYGTFNFDVSISQMLPTNVSACCAKAGAAAITAKNAIAAELMLFIVTTPLRLRLDEEAIGVAGDRVAHTFFLVSGVRGGGWLELQVRGLLRTRDVDRTRYRGPLGGLVDVVGV